MHSIHSRAQMNKVCPLRYDQRRNSSELINHTDDAFNHGNDVD